MEVIPNGWQGRKQRLAFSELTQISHVNSMLHGGQLVFATKKMRHPISTVFLDRTPQEILRLIEIRLEKDGRFLARPSDSNQPAKAQVWTVAKGHPYGAVEASAPPLLD